MYGLIDGTFGPFVLRGIEMRWYIRLIPPWKLEFDLHAPAQPAKKSESYTQRETTMYMFHQRESRRKIYVREREKNPSKFVFDRFFHQRKKLIRFLRPAHVTDRRNSISLTLGAVGVRKKYGKMLLRGKKN